MSEHNTLTIDLKIPFEVDNLIGEPALTFFHWLPLEKDNGIILSENGISLNFWFNIKAVWGVSRPTEEEITNHRNVLAQCIFCEVKVVDIDSKLAVYMQDKKNNDVDNSENGVLKEEYENLGTKILDTVLTRINRLISYARDVKGQYWLFKYPINMGQMSSFFVKFDAIGQIDGGKKFHFNPNTPHCMTLTMQSDERYIRKNEWDEIIDFVRSERSTPLALELLAGAEQLAGNGYERGALTEAVTALEVALSTFAENPKNNDELSSIMGARMNVSNLKKQIKHMGLSGSVNYLLPVILPDSILSGKILKGCQEAITKRQNVVHNGGRNVEKLDYYIFCIRACCKILLDFSEKHSAANTSFSLSEPCKPVS